MWELDCEESWAPKNWCFWTVVLEKTLESPLDYKEIQPVHPKDQSWVFIVEGLMLRLKLQYFGHLVQRVDSLERPWCWERLRAGGEGEDRGWNVWLVTDWMDMSLGKLQELVMDREASCAAIHGVTKSQTRLSDWTDWEFCMPSASQKQLCLKLVLHIRVLDKHYFEKEVSWPAKCFVPQAKMCCNIPNLFLSHSMTRSSAFCQLFFQNTFWI